MSISTKLLLIGLMLTSCATTATNTNSSSVTHNTAQTARTSLVSQQTLERYTAPALPRVAAPDRAPHSGGEGFVAPRGQTLQIPYDVLCLNAEAQAAVEANVTYRDEIAQNNCNAAVRTLGAQAARDLSLVDAASATRESVLGAQVRSAADAVAASNQTINQLRGQLTSNSRFGVLINFLVGLGGLTIGAGLAAVIADLMN